MEVDYLLTKEWIYTQKITGSKPDGSLDGLSITRPPGVEQLILTLEILQSGGNGLKQHCVYYRVPYKTNPGLLKIIELKNLSACPDTAPDLTPESTPDTIFASLENIVDLSMRFKNFKLEMTFIQDKIKRLIEIPMMNIESGLIHKKHSSLTENRLYDGMRLLRLTDDSFDYASNRSLGKLSDRFGNGNAIRCHQVNKNCEDVGENRCDDCRYGWYEVVDFQCNQGGSKFCGQNHCGEKNEPACPRGVKVADSFEAGICQNDLEPILNADKILICQ